MIPLADELFAGKGCQKTEIRRGFREGHRPRNVSRNDDGVRIGDQRAPSAFELIRVACPASAEFFHGFGDGAGEMGVRDCVDCHRSVLERHVGHIRGIDHVGEPYRLVQGGGKRRGDLGSGGVGQRAKQLFPIEIAGEHRRQICTDLR